MGNFHLEQRNPITCIFKTVEDDPTLPHCYGVKKACPLTKKLCHFSFARGYPPDILHDLFEGIVPKELSEYFH